MNTLCACSSSSQLTQNIGLSSAKAGCAAKLLRWLAAVPRGMKALLICCTADALSPGWGPLDPLSLLEARCETPRLTDVMSGAAACGPFFNRISNDGAAELSKLPLDPALANIVDSIDAILAALGRSELDQSRYSTDRKSRNKLSEEVLDARYAGRPQFRTLKHS